MERDPRKENLNLVENSRVQQMVGVVEAVEPTNPVEKARKFHYLQTFAADVVKVDIKKDNLVRHWR